MTTLIVYDGDNLAISAKNMYLKDRDRLEKRRLNRRLVEFAQNRGDTVLPAVYFRSPGPKVVPVGSGGTSFVDDKSGMVFHYYEIVGNHGYTDQQLMDYIDTRRSEFDRLILVTSDNDFFDFAARYAAAGCKVEVFSLKLATAQPTLKLLGKAKHHWLDELIAVPAASNAPHASTDNV